MRVRKKLRQDYGYRQEKGKVQKKKVFCFSFVCFFTLYYIWVVLNRNLNKRLKVGRLWQFIHLLRGSSAGAMQATTTTKRKTRMGKRNHPHVLWENLLRLLVIVVVFFKELVCDIKETENERSCYCWWGRWVQTMRCEVWQWNIHHGHSGVYVIRNSGERYRPGPAAQTTVPTMDDAKAKPLGWQHER